MEIKFRVRIIQYTYQKELHIPIIIKVQMEIKNPLNFLKNESIT
jgi:hypothetical protein